MKRYVSWEELKKEVPQSCFETIKSIKEKITLEDLNYLTQCIQKLNNPQEIKKLGKFQKEQEELGAWVQGFLPDQFPEEEKLVIPNNIENLLLLIDELAKQKEMNLQAIEDLNSYPLRFKEVSFISKEKTYPDKWKLHIDIESIKRLIESMKKDKISYEEALKLAETQANQEMLKHRRNLSYLPGHKTTTEDLTQLIMNAQSKKPLELIWKWLNPMNCFDMADIFTCLDEYDALIQLIETKHHLITSEILGTIHEYIKLDLLVSETFGLTVGFGIRGWATSTMAGANIEYIKNNFQLLLGIIGHEVFHRMQMLIFSNQNKKTESFEEMVEGPYNDEKDNKLYEVLSYILLEGTGEIIKYDLMQGDDYYSDEKVTEGIHLLNHIYDEIYVNNNIDKVEEYLNQGLISTGPFYSLGKAFADILIKRYTKSIIGELLNEGTLSFYKNVFDHDVSHLQLKPSLVNKIKTL